MEKLEYIYGMRLRGFSVGCQPLDGLKRREDCPKGKYNRNYWDIIIYNRLLEDWELRSFELDYLGTAISSN